MNADRLTEIRHIAPTAGPLGQKAINELLAENASSLEARRLAKEEIDRRLQWELDLMDEVEDLRDELEELRRNGAGTVQQLRAELEKSRSDSLLSLKLYTDCLVAISDACDELRAPDDVQGTVASVWWLKRECTQARAELADLHNVEADLRAERDALRGYRDRLGERVLDHVQRTSLIRKDCCGAPWDAPHRSGCEEPK